MSKHATTKPVTCETIEYKHVKEMYVLLMPTAGYAKKANVERSPAIVTKLIITLFLEKYPMIKKTTATEHICIGSIILRMFCQEKSEQITKFTTLETISKNKSTDTKIVSRIFFAL